MRSIKILDCTLRDGGFVNDWNFGIGSIKSIISRLDASGIDIIEVGFLDSRRPYDVNRSMLPDTDSVKPMFHNLHVDNAMIVGMIDYGTCGIESISDRKDSCLEGIRVIFKKKDADDAVRFCGEIAKKGYKVFVQPVSITSYTDVELTALLEKINGIDPFSVSIVDTYGLLHKKELLHLFSMFDSHVQKKSIIGYHAHNNFQLAYANAIELMEIDSDRELMIDGSLYGMGKGAGNANTELLAMYLNENYGTSYRIDQLLEAIDVDISKEYAKKYWGYSLMHFIAASNDCHPDYVNCLIGKKTLSVKSINEILSGLDPKTKLSFDKKLIEDAYVRYQENLVEDSAVYESLQRELAGRDVLVLGPGKTIETHHDSIMSFIAEKKPVVISINFVCDDIRSDYVFMGNAKRYSQFFNKIYADGAAIRVIGTSNITEAGKKIDHVLNFASLANDHALIRDNPFLMLLKVLGRAEVRSVHAAGLDGYGGGNSQNYFGEYVQFLYCSDDVSQRNDLIREAIRTMKNRVRFITPSIYDQA